MSKQHLPEVSKDGNDAIRCSPVALGLFAWFLHAPCLASGSQVIKGLICIFASLNS